MTATGGTRSRIPARAIAMIHTEALPGTPFNNRPPDEIVERAQRDAAALAECGFRAAIIENMRDRPYVNHVGPEIVAMMTRIGCAVREAAPSLTLGVQILSMSSRETLAVAHAVGAFFVRIENFVFAQIGDEGLAPTAQAGDLLRYRRQIGAGDIAILADIKKKHASHALTADLGVGEVAAAAEFFGADGVIVTGETTGRPVDVDDLDAAREAASLPIIVGSGAAHDTIGRLLQHADAAIVGSALKIDGVWSNELDLDRCRRFIDAVESAKPHR